MLIYFNRLRPITYLAYSVVYSRASNAMHFVQRTFNHIPHTTQEITNGYGYWYVIFINMEYLRSVLISYELVLIVFWNFFY